MRSVILLPVLIVALLLSSSLTAHGQDTDKAGKKNYVHTLGLADRVRIVVYQEDDLTSLTRIDARGRVNMPLLGEIVIGGRGQPACCPECA